LQSRFSAENQTPRLSAAQIAQWLEGSAFAGHPITNCRTTPVAVRQNSLLFYSECTGLPSPALVKICLNASTRELDGDAAVEQYDAARRVHEAMRAGSVVCVPEPYLIRREAGLVAMEWIPGDSMSAVLSSWRCSAATALDCMVRCATWLRAFHDAGGCSPGHLDVQQRLLRVDEMESHRAVPDPVFRQGVHELRAAAGAAAERVLPRAWIHGDFKADNLIRSGPRTIGIDVHLRDENAVVYDLASFLNNLALRLFEPAGWLLARSHGRLRSTFVSSYFGSSGEDMLLPLKWVQLFMLLYRWHSARRRGWRSAYVDYCHRRIASVLITGIAQSGGAEP
jgi:tRNA A-37 threonylcarbamoyl transferase component Bud32